MKSKIIFFFIFVLLAGNAALAADTYYFGGIKRTLSSATDEVNAGYHENQSLSAVDTDLAPSNIKKSKNIFGKVGTYEGTGLSHYGLPKTGEQPGLPSGAPFATGDDAYYADPAANDIGYPRGKGTWAAYNTARFTDNGNSTVTDNATGLMWLKDPAGVFTGGTCNWATAISNCENLSFAGYTDWRLPNIRELLSIVDFSRYSGDPQGDVAAVDKTYFSGYSAVGYHTSTTAANITTNNWYVQLTLGNAFCNNGKSFLYVTAVRGGITAPVLTTTVVTDITTNSASSGGNITSNGGTAVTARGVCWNTNGNPTIADSKTTDGSGTGSFTSSLTGLASCTKYYVRAYATNSTGTGYGSEVSFTTPVNVGQNYGGGIVFYVDGTGHHGLIATIGDISTGIQWYNGSYKLTNATGTAVGTGQSNTNLIIAAQGAGSYAAKLCDDYVTVEGEVTYDDWFLPSLDELNLLWLLTGGESGNWDWSSDYWTSTEVATNYAWCQNGYNGNQFSDYWKYWAWRVRAVRDF